MAQKSVLSSQEGKIQIDIEYLQEITLEIAERNSHGKIIKHNKLQFTTTRPINQKSDIFLQDRPIKVSGCVLPGLNPHGDDKKCQDNYTYAFLNGLIFCGLFDGHGPVGEQVSAFGIKFCHKYFLQNAHMFDEKPKETLIHMLELCDKELHQEEIEYELSGSTAVIVLLSNNSIHTASLGDSRAILGTISDMSFALPAPQSKFHRHFTVGRVLKPIPLTIDQKPNHEEEYVRIRSAGGIVERITDVMGNTIGPYRVWKPQCDLPGLAMSRSIGDGVGKTIGVISTPVYHYFTLYADNDQYIVLASDGIWDVMENAEVITFIEKFKEKCESSIISDEYPARTLNSSIARLLCEEARYRWYGLIEAEDVNIDDISCIVIDLSRRGISTESAKPERNVKAFQSLALGKGYQEHLENYIKSKDEQGDFSREKTEEDKSEKEN